MALYSRLKPPLAIRGRPRIVAPAGAPSAEQISALVAFCPSSKRAVAHAALVILTSALASSQARAWNSTESLSVPTGSQVGGVASARAGTGLSLPSSFASSGPFARGAGQADETFTPAMVRGARDARSPAGVLQPASTYASTPANAKSASSVLTPSSTRASSLASVKSPSGSPTPSGGYAGSGAYARAGSGFPTPAANYARSPASSLAATAAITCTSAAYRSTVAIGYSPIAEVQGQAVPAGAWRPSVANSTAPIAAVTCVPTRVSSAAGVQAGSFSGSVPAGGFSRSPAFSRSAASALGPSPAFVDAYTVALAATASLSCTAARKGTEAIVYSPAAQVEGVAVPAGAWRPSVASTRAAGAVAIVGTPSRVPPGARAIGPTLEYPCSVARVGSSARARALVSLQTPTPSRVESPSRGWASVESISFGAARSTTQARTWPAAGSPRPEASLAAARTLAFANTQLTSTIPFGAWARGAAAPYAASAYELLVVPVAFLARYPQAYSTSGVAVVFTGSGPVLGQWGEETGIRGTWGAADSLSGEWGDDEGIKGKWGPVE